MAISRHLGFCKISFLTHCWSAGCRDKAMAKIWLKSGMWSIEFSYLKLSALEIMRRSYLTLVTAHWAELLLFINIWFVAGCLLAYDWLLLHYINACMPIFRALWWVIKYYENSVSLLIGTSQIWAILRNS